MSIDSPNSPALLAPLLVSVQSVSEAESIIDLPVGILDFKNPADGALGRCRPNVLHAATALTTPGLGASAACGELSAAISAWQELPKGFRFAKAGPSGLRTIESHREALRQFARLVPDETLPVAVAYADNVQADSLSPEEILRNAMELGYEWFLIDTASKNGCSLFDWIAPERLCRMIESCHSAGMRSVVAGSITLKQLPLITSCCPDLIGVRGAVCVDGRTSKIVPRLVAELCQHVLEHLKPLDIDSTGLVPLEEPSR